MADGAASMPGVYVSLDDLLALNTADARSLSCRTSRYAACCPAGSRRACGAVG